ncbi:MAG: hypothetical protein RBT38_12805 [Bacteroidales bacterium]|jgi:hypothetical protein|nr:hypothetical protein [Bacteroidales bacterium]
MFEKTIISHKELEVRVSDHANEAMLEILSQAVQGSEGGFRFQLQNIPARIAAYGDQIRFVTLYRKNKVTGTVGSCYRMTGQGKLRYSSSHLRYLAFLSVYQTSYKPGKKRKDLIKTEKDDTFKNKTLEIFSKPHLLDFDHVDEDQKHIMYAFIESMNERSKSLVSKAGYEYIRSFLTVAFSRFNPKPDSRVSRLSSDGEKKEMESLLLSYYRNHSFFSTDNVFFGDKYYVMRENGRIVAGVSAIPSSYRIYDMPGVWGWISMKILPDAPLFKRLFNPNEFRHLVFHAIYCEEGREELLADLFGSVCATEGYNTGLTWLDDRSDLFDKLRSGVRMGALNRILNAKPGLVYARFINLSEEEKDCFYDAPAYISGFDFS